VLVVKLGKRLFGDNGKLCLNRAGQFAGVDVSGDKFDEFFFKKSYICRHIN